MRIVFRGVIAIECKEKNVIEQVPECEELKIAL